MKATKFIMVFVAAAAMMFASCGKEDNNSNENENNQTSPIVGTWEYHETSFEGIRYYTEIMSFKADGTATVQFTCYDTYADGSTWHYGKSMTGPYTIDGANLHLKLYYNGIMESEDSEFTYSEPDMSQEPDKEFAFTFEIAGNTLKVDRGEEVIFGHGGHPGVMEYIKK